MWSSDQTFQEMREMDVQTVSKCELCHQQIQLCASSSALVKNQFQCATCPAFIQLFKGMSCSKLVKLIVSFSFLLFFYNNSSEITSLSHISRVWIKNFFFKIISQNPKINDSWLLNVKIISSLYEINILFAIDCRCVTGMMHMPRQNRQQQTQQPKFDKETTKGRNLSQSTKRNISSEMLTSEKARKVDQVANLGVQ